MSEIALWQPKPREQYAVGARIEHSAHGLGTIRSGSEANLVVQFERAGQRLLKWDEDFWLLDDQGAPAPLTPPAPAQVMPYGISAILALALEEVQPSDLNPRRVDESYIEQLSIDIRANGQINPVTVRELGPPNGPHRYEIISGECRFRACIKAGMETILAISRGPISAEEAYAETIRENAQRRDLNCLEEARAVAQMSSGFRWSQERIGQLLGGKSQSWVSRTTALLGLPGQVQELIHQGLLTRTHAEELVPLLRWPQTLIELAREAAANQWSVSALAALAKEKRQRFEEKERPALPELLPDGGHEPMEHAAPDAPARQDTAAAEPETQEPTPNAQHPTEWAVGDEVTVECQGTPCQGRVSILPASERHPIGIDLQSPIVRRAWVDLDDPTLRRADAEATEPDAQHAEPPTEDARELNASVETAAEAPAPLNKPAEEAGLPGLTTPAPERKPLKSMAEIAADKAAAKQEAAPAPPPPVQIILPAPLSQRMEGLGLGWFSAINLACQVTEIAREFGVGVSVIPDQLRAHLGAATVPDPEAANG
jgi:ParB/RepB/Spo0J family partition protein